MNAQIFFDLVGQMRAAQKKYFTQGRLQSDLIESKELEKRVDQVLKDGLDQPGEPVQLTLTEDQDKLGDCPAGTGWASRPEYQEADQKKRGGVDEK